MSKLYRLSLACMLLLLISGLTFSQKYPDAKTTKHVAGVPHILKDQNSSRDALFTESFENANFPPIGWTLDDQNASFSWERFLIDGAFDGDYIATVQYDSTLNQQNELLYTDAYDLTGLENATLTFSWFASYTWSVSPNDNYDMFVEISTDGGSTWTQLWTEEDEGVFSNYVWYTTEIVLNDYIGETVNIGFRYVGLDGAQAGIDAISLTDEVPCEIGDATTPSPMIGASGVSASGTVGTWENNPNATYNTVYFGSDFNDLEMVLGDGETLYDTYEFPEMEYSTTYYWAVVSYTSESCYSIGPVWSFTTEFDPSLPIIQFDDFEGVPSLPANYTIVNANEDGNEWQVVDIEDFAHSGTHSMRIRWNSTANMNDWFFIGPFDLEAATEYTVDFWYRSGSATSYPEKLEVVYSTTTDSTGVVDQIVDLPNIMTTTYENSANSFTPAEAGSYYIGFHGYSLADMYYLAVDDIMILGESEPVNEGPLYTIDIATSDGVGGSYDIKLGVDPSATDGIDADLNEDELPPLPPAGVYDMRLILPDGQTASYVDYRYGDNEMSAEVTYEINWQPGTGSTALTLDINIPEVQGDVSMVIKDPLTGTVFNQEVYEGQSQVVVENLELTTLLLVVDYNGPLPVELTGFSANVAGETVQLNWSTATETNNKGFEIERSEDNTNFQKIGYVEGNGTTVSQHTYSFTDNSALSGNYYYRLKQIDFNGAAHYSNVVEVEFMPTAYSLGQNYPNPFNPSTTIKFALPVESKVTVTLFNMLGQKVRDVVSGQFAAGTQEVNLNASDLASGMYIYTISATGTDGSNFVDTKKMMLMK